MLLIDFSQVVISNVVSLQTSKQTRQELTIDFMRHVVLNSIRKIRAKFPNEAKETILCCDGRNYWRKDIFPYYKANREKAKKDMPGVDWPMLFKFLDEIKHEIKENLPFKLLQVDRCEADDLIAILVTLTKEPTIIVSTDADFLQLQAHSHVRQYNVVKDVFMTPTGGPVSFLKEKIIKGDTGDGIPNILSADDTFVSGKRQGVMTKARMDKFLAEDCGNYDEQSRTNFIRNENLIDLMTRIPDTYSGAIKDAYEAVEKPTGQLYNYLLKHNLKYLAANSAGLT